MQQLSSTLADMGQNHQLVSVCRSLFVFTACLLLARLLGAAAQRALAERITAHQTMVARRAVFYTVLTIGSISALRELGFSLHAVLGAAGVLSVALGFAAQTSASNLISGLFLITERPFVIGDVVRIGATTGEVLSIDLLSIKIRTFDNLYVRVPNESVVKSEVTNMTHFPIRRADLSLAVGYGSDLARVQQLLAEVARANPLCLDHPEPVYILLGLGDSALEIQYSVWTARPNFLALKNSILQEIKQAFDANGIEIPFPQRSLRFAPASEPLPVRLLSTTRD